MNESRTIRLPTTIWPALHHLARAQAALWQQKQREPSPDELAEAMRCAKEQVLLLLHLQHEPVSLEQPMSSEEETTRFGDQLAAPDETEQREQQREVAGLLTHLSPRERRVIQTRYQLGPTGAYNVRGPSATLHGGESTARHDGWPSQSSGDTCAHQATLLGNTSTLRARRLGLPGYLVMECRTAAPRYATVPQ